MKQKQPKAKKKFQSESMDTTDPRSLNFEKHKRERERESWLMGWEGETMKYDWSKRRARRCAIQLMYNCLFPN
jgi:hypothetical protein